MWEGPKAFRAAAGKTRKKLIRYLYILPYNSQIQKTKPRKIILKFRGKEISAFLRHQTRGKRLCRSENGELRKKVLFNF